MINASRAAFVCLFKFKLRARWQQPLRSLGRADSKLTAGARRGGAPAAGSSAGCAAGPCSARHQLAPRVMARGAPPDAAVAGKPPTGAAPSAVNGQVQPQAEGPASDGEARPRLADQSETATSPRPPVRIVQQRTCRLLCKKYTQETHDAIAALRTTPAASDWVSDSMQPLAGSSESSCCEAGGCSATWMGSAALERNWKGRMPQPGEGRGDLMRVREVRSLAGMWTEPAQSSRDVDRAGANCSG